MKQDISRREFLKTASLAALAFLIPSITNADQKYEIKRKEFLEYVAKHSESKCIFSQELKRDKKNQSYLEISLETYDVCGDKPLILDYYPIFSLTKKTRPPIVIFPMSSGKEDFVDGYLARNFREAGFPSIIVDTKPYWKELREQLEDINFGDNLTKFTLPLNNLFEKELYATHKTFEWIGEKEELQENNIGVFGLSRGGILAANYYGNIDRGKRIKAMVIVIGGGNVPEIISTSEEPGIKEIRERILGLTQKSEKQLEDQLRKDLIWDPLKGAASIENANSIMMYIAKKDTFVPEENGTELAKAFGTTNVRYMRRTPINLLAKIITPFTPHPKSFKEYTNPHIISTIQRRGKIKRQSLKFFQEKLA